ncbi:M28 family peptidase [Olivibacter domesticus]|uniref:Peptidase family M28 n=1 Tax=Olivibacter domesticus TaxID=407022 RepID=A0A1H7HKX7_OLID1|nr:M28 family peptidase [Olivibacter domesticus]SEK50911.1 Peptidase family M28 [Olivibacter domesticus]
MPTILKKIPFAFLLFAMSCCASVKQQDDRQLHTTLLNDIKTLSSDNYEGRKTGTAGAEKARAYITERFTKLGIKPFPDQSNYLQPFMFQAKDSKQFTGQNVLGYIPGKLKECIVISAHYDHLGTEGNKIYNGADDNASGVAALLHFAEYFSKNPPNFTLIFAAFDAEEMGLKGAKAFVDAPPVALHQIKLNINMDMIAHNDKNELYACGTFTHPELKKYIITDHESIKITLGHDDPKTGHDDWTNQSDQGAFNAKNIPFIYFGVEDHKDYHQPTDDFENINQDFFVGATKAILAVIKNIDGKLSSKIQIDKNKIMK